MKKNLPVVIIWCHPDILCNHIPIWDTRKIHGKYGLKILLVEKIPGLLNAIKDLSVLLQYLE